MRCGDEADIRSPLGRKSQRDGIGAGRHQQLDDINKQIIEHLQRDGRMPYAALAKTIGLPEAAGGNTCDGRAGRLGNASRRGRKP
jgi:hypothetical protein